MTMGVVLLQQALPTLLLLLLLLQSVEEVAGTVLRHNENLSLGPGWGWVSRMGQMGGKEFGQAATPMLQMCKNVATYGADHQAMPINGWAVSSRIPPLVVPEIEDQTGRVLALVYEEEQENCTEIQEHQRASPRAVVAFRSHSEVAGGLENCAAERLGMRARPLNATLLFTCFATYNCTASLDYYSQALTYTLQALQHYPPSSVLMTGDSMGAALAVLAAAGVWTQYAMVLPAMVFEDPGPLRSMGMRDISLQGSVNGTIVSISNEWDPVMRLNWDNHAIGTTLCLLPPAAGASQAPLYECLRCFKTHDEEGDDCQTCVYHNHNSSLLLDRFAEGADPTCSLIGDGRIDY